MSLSIANNAPSYFICDGERNFCLEEGWVKLLELDIPSSSIPKAKQQDNELKNQIIPKVPSQFPYLR